MPARKKLGLYIFQIILWLLLSTKSVYGGTAPTFSNLPSSTSVNQEIEVDISFAGDPRYYKEKTYYLRGVFYQQDSKYCSLTQNNAGEWINSGTIPSDLFEFTTNQEGSWSGKLKVKVDKESSSCSGSGEYQFKVGRYTSSSASWSDAQSLQVINPTPIPTPTTSSSTPTPENNKEDDYEDEQEENFEDKTEKSSSSRGVVAGYSTTNAQKSATFSDTLKIREATQATPSAQPEFQVASTSAESSEKSKGIVNKILVISGLGLTGASIVSFALKKYNKTSLWKKILDQFKTS